MSETFLPYGRQWVQDEDIQAVVDVLQSDFLTTGPVVPAFEKAICEYSGAGFAVAVNSGTSALHCAYHAAGLGEGDEIVTSPLTFAATANAALYLGATVRFVDVEPDTGNLDPALIEEALRPQTKLVVPVDFGGHPAEYDSINALATQKGFTVVADAAHSFGATYKGRKVGTLCDVTEISMHPVKPITTAEGGAVLTSDPAAAKKAALFRTHGITRDADDLLQNDGAWYYEMQTLGYNYRITDLQCALGVSQLSRIDSYISRRQEIAERYSSALKAVPALQLPVQREDVRSGWHLYAVRVQEASRRKPFFDRLRELKLGVQVHYIPVHYHPYYQQLGYQKGSCPVAEDFYARCVSLPMYPKMTDSEVDSSIERVIRAAREVL